MKHSTLFVLAVGLVLSVVVAPGVLGESVAVPQGFADVEDDGYSHTFRGRIRMQEVYSAAQFPAGPLTIQEIRFRRDASQGPVTTSLTAQISLSTTEKAPDALSAVFADNMGADNTVVFDGTVEVSSTGATVPGAPNAYDIIIPLSRTFTYDPAKGNLLLEIRNFSNSDLQSVDASNNLDHRASRLFSFEPNDETASAGQDRGADIVQFVRQSPPLTSFVRLTPAVLDTPSDTMSGEWCDFDRDGDLDLLVARNGSANLLVRNDGHGSLAPLADSEFTDLTAHSGACATADYDNDGDVDLLLDDLVMGPVLWEQNPDGTFSKLTESGFEPGGGQSYGVSWADYDRDGWLDLIVIKTFAKNHLYRNNHDGLFTRVLDGPVGAETGAGMGCAWADYDNDGHADLFVANGAGQNNLLYRNNGDGSFSAITEGTLVTDRGESESAAWGDYDNDGDLDVFVANRLGPNFLYRNDGNGTFTKIAEGAVATDRGESNGCGWADFDNDGFLDLFVANWQGNPGFLYRNLGSGQFERVTAGDLGVDVAQSVGGAWGDFDGNGFLDLFVANLGAADALYQNQGNGNHWLQVQCLGVLSNRDAIGAKVRVRTTVGGETWWQMREISSGRGWDSDGPGAHFGLGPAVQVDVLRVEWPSGNVQELTDLPANQTLTVVEDVGSELPNVLANYSFEDGLSGWTTTGYVEVLGPPRTAMPVGTDGTHAAALGTFEVSDSTLSTQSPLALSPGGNYLVQFDLQASGPTQAGLTATVKLAVQDTSGSKVYAEGVFSETSLGTVHNGAEGFVSKSLGFSLGAQDSEVVLRFSDLTSQSGVDPLLDNIRIVREASSRPGFVPSPGFFTNLVSVEITNPFEFGEIRYTLDGTVPMISSTLFADKIVLTAATTIKARVFFNGYPITDVATATFTRVYAIDDGIPDSWREQYFGPGYRTDPRVSAEADPDGDGATNLEEFTAGTHPLDPLSGFKVGIKAVPMIRWFSAPNAHYRILRKASVAAQEWTVVVPDFVATDSMSIYFDVDAPGPHAFYVVEVVN